MNLSGATNLNKFLKKYFLTSLPELLGCGNRFFS